jgi:hypothetical protein
MYQDAFAIRRLSMRMEGSTAQAGRQYVGD